MKAWALAGVVAWVIVLALTTTRVGCWVAGHAPPDAGWFAKKLLGGYRCRRCRQMVDLSSG